jgi:hypothetical protein
VSGRDEEMPMRSKQAGVTFIGWIILLIPVAICGYAGIRLAPVYLNYMKVAKTLEQLKSELKGDPGSPTLVRNAIQRHFDIENVSYPESKDIKVTRDGGKWIVSAAYDDQTPLFANLFILVTFDKTVTLGGGASN